jgi:hypothetical protein
VCMYKKKKYAKLDTRIYDLVVSLDTNCSPQELLDYISKMSYVCPMPEEHKDADENDIGNINNDNDQGDGDGDDNGDDDDDDHDDDDDDDDDDDGDDDDDYDDDDDEVDDEVDEEEDEEEDEYDEDNE